MNNHQFAETIGMTAGYSQRGSVLGQADAAARQAEIPHQLEKLERTLKNCVQGLEILGERLAQSVMRSEPPGTSNKLEPTSIPSTSLGSQLQAHVNVAAEINARIQSMFDRLEV